MKQPAMVRKIATLCLLLAANATSAAVLTVSASIADAPESQSACASNPDCRRQDSLPVPSSPGEIAGKGSAPASANGMSYAMSSFAAGRAMDDVLLSPVNSQPTAYPSVPTYVTDAAEEFTTYQDLKWNVKLKLLRAYTSVRSVLSLIDMGDGDARDTDKIVSVQSNEAGAAAINAGYTAAGMASDASTLCVATDGSYNTIGAATQKNCPVGSIFVSTHRSASMAEYAAYSQSLSNIGKGAAAPKAAYLADLRYPGTETAPRQYRRCGECNADQADAQEPSLPLQILRWMKEPSAMLLVLALAVVAALISDVAGKGRRA